MMTLSEAALKLDEELKTHYNLSKWAYLGINEDPREPEIIIYTQTKKDAQHLSWVSSPPDMKATSCELKSLAK